MDSATIGWESRKPQAESGNGFGDYDLLEEIACGGMGIVYRARQQSLNRVVAIKLLLFGAHATPEAIKRFRAEAVAAAALQHPNIVTVHEVGIHEGQHFIVMDYVEGQCLSALIGGQPLPARSAARYVKIIAEAIHFAHERGILHRDLKPSNVLIDANDQPRVTDFGLAKRLDDSQLSTLNPQLTLTGQVLGSPSYIPPEQAMGKRGKLSRRSDVYALGALLFHALTGRPPFLGESVADTVQQVLNVEPLSPQLLNPGVPRDLETICLKCLEKESARRYATAQELADELGRFQAGEPIHARPLGRTAKLWRWCRRKPQMASLAAAAILTFLLGFAGVVWQWRQSEAHRQRAEAGELSAAQNAYVLAINAAQQALKANNPGRALELLNRQRPVGKSEIDLRGFEWRYLWQQCQSDAEALLGTLPSRIRSLEVSPDGNWLAAGSERGTLKVWNLATGEEIILLSDQGWKSFGSFSPDSRLLLYTDQSTNSWGTIRIWDTQTRERRIYITNSWAIGLPVFAPNDKWLGYGAVDRQDLRRKAIVVDFATRASIGEMNALTAVTDDFHGLDWVFTFDSRCIILSENAPDRRIALGDFTVGSEPQHNFPGHTDAITALAISPDGHTLATGAGLTRLGVYSLDNAIKLWELPSFRPLGEFAGHDGWIAALMFSPDGQRLASGSADQTIRLWDVRSKTNKWVSRRLPEAVMRVCFAADGRTLFSGCQDGQVHRWSLDVPPNERHFSRASADLDFLTVATSGKQFAGIRGGAVHVGESQRVPFAKPIRELGTNNRCLLFAANQQFLFAGTWRGEVQVWSLSDRRLMRRLQPCADPIERLLQDAQGRALGVVQCAGGVIREGRPCRIGIWNVAGWQEQKSWVVSGYRLASALSPDGRWLATGDPSGPVQVWNLEGLAATNIASFSAGTITDVTFSPDGRLLAACNEEGTVSVWEIPTFREVSFRANKRDALALTFSPDSRRLATAGDGDEALKLWDVATWQELITIADPHESLPQIAFGADGHQLTALTSQGDLLLWCVPSLGEIEGKEQKERSR